MKLRSFTTSSIVAAIMATGIGFATAQDEDAQKKATHGHEASHHGGVSKLIAAIHPVGDSEVKGVVLFEKTEDGVKVTAEISGLEADSEHAFHVHEFGDLTSDDATSAGSHFNPEGHEHGLPDQDEERHAGDFGNLKADSDGNARYVITVDNITLDTGTHGIVGRSVIIHAKKDDGGQPTGNAGDRIGAGVIGIPKDAVKVSHEDHAAE